MTTSLLSTLRRHFAPLCLAFAFLAFAATTRADDDAPTFSDPDVTSFAKDYGTFVDEGVVIMKDYMAAAKANDTAKMQADQQKVQAFQTKAQELQTRGAALQGKLKADETKKFTDYMQKEVKKLTDSLQGQ